MNVQVLLLLVLCAGAIAKVERRCKHQNKSYAVGSFWVYQSKVCECLPNGRVRCHERLGKCNAWGDPHFTSYDGKVFDFQGVCRYILSRDCCGNKFSIEVENVPYSPSTSVTDKFTIRFGSRVVDLEKVQVLKVDTLTYPGLFFNDAQVRCEMIGGYMMVTLKNLGVWFRWNFQYHVQVYVHPEYSGQLCGLCADFNGQPSNDLTLTPTGEPVSTIPQWGESWRTMQQPERCNGSENSNSGDDDEDCRKNPKYQSQIALCKTVISLPEFDKCRSVVNPGNYIKDCETEMCECAKLEKPGCICHAVSAYIDACADAGVAVSDSWKVKYGCGSCKDPITGQQYEHGQSWKHRCTIFTCINGEVTEKMLPGCCFDQGRYYQNGQSWRYKCEIRTCKDGEIVSLPVRDCCHDMGKSYPNGATWFYKCQIRTCRNGIIIRSLNRECCYYNRRYYQHGQSFTNRCRRCVCIRGRWICQMIFVKCRPGWVRISPCLCVRKFITIDPKKIAASG